MGNHPVKQPAVKRTEIRQVELEPLPKLLTEYYPDTRTLVLDTGAKWAEGEEIAHGLTVFYDHDNNVVGFTLEATELILKPLLDAVMAKHRGESNPPVLQQDLNKPAK